LSTLPGWSLGQGDPAADGGMERGFNAARARAGADAVTIADAPGAP